MNHERDPEPEPEKPQTFETCQGVTRQGKPCKLKPTNESGIYCNNHLPSKPA